MRADEIRIGDELHVKGQLAYVVEDVIPQSGSTITARVRFVDGGEDFRSWHADDDVPLTRP